MAGENEPERVEGVVIMVQIIERKTQADKHNVDFPHSNIQVSYNSNGHLVVRNYWNNDSDKLLVFDERVSREIIKFVLKVFGPRENDRLPF